MNQTNSPPVLTVSQLTQAIKLSLESTFPNICLQGEISNFKLQTSGHLYFSLKDANAQIFAVMFRGDAQLLKLLPKDGDQVLVKGAINVYPSKGNYQFIIRELSYAGMGELLQKLELLKLKLHQKGWFKAARKRALPKLPKRIGVVTSPTGAVIQDILNILSRRFSSFHLILNPVKVQGEGAAQEIASAIEQFNRHALVDVMIVGRGGGSLEDLWAFNEECVAEAIYNSQIPVISAVGHETDHCIADYVADVRAPTPSAAAEMVIAEKGQLLDYLATIKRRMHQTIRHTIQKDRYRLIGLLKHPLFARSSTLLEVYMQKLDDIRIDLDQRMQQFMQMKRHQIEVKSKQTTALKPTTQLSHFKQRLSICEKSLKQYVCNNLEFKKNLICQKQVDLLRLWQSRHQQRRNLYDANRIMKSLDQLLAKQLGIYKERIKNISTTLQAIDPKKLLHKGYSILFSEKERCVINSVKQLKKSQKASLWLSDGEALITINETISRDS